MKSKLLILMAMLVLILLLGAGGTYPIRHNTVQPARSLVRLLNDRIGTLDDEVTALEASQSGTFSNIGTGSVFYVDSGAAADGAGTTWATAVDTLQEGINLCTANRGDIVYVAQDHEENIASAAALDFDCAGITVVGIGNGTDMPTISLITLLTAYAEISDPDVMIYNLRFIGNFTNGVTKGFNISALGDGAIIAGCEFRETTSDKEQLIMLNITAAAHECIIVGNSFIGIDGGDDSVAINMAGASNQTIISGNHFYGDWSDYVIKNGATSISMLIENNVINNLDTGAGKLMSFSASSTGSVVNNHCYGNGDTFAFVGAAMFMSPDNVFQNTEVVTRTLEQMIGPFTGATAGTVGTTIHADMVLAQTDLDDILANMLTYGLDELVSNDDSAGVTAYPDSVVQDSILAYLMDSATSPVKTNYDNTTMSLRALNTDLDTIIVDTGTTLPASFTTVTNAIVALSDTGYVGTNTAASTTAPVVALLAGFGDDYFNTGWSMICAHNVGGAAAAPENEVRDITDYVSGSGTFTVLAFSAALANGDKVIVKRTEDLELDVPTTLGTAGTVRYVDSGNSAGNSTGLTWINAYDTIQIAVTASVAGDVIYVADGHNEAIGSLLISTANLSIIGLGEGDGRPILDFDGAGEEITINAAGVVFKNFRLLPSDAAVVAGIVLGVNGDGCLIENVAFIDGEAGGGGDDFASCIVFDTGTVGSTVRNCTYKNLGATAADQDTFVNISAATIADATIEGCNVFGTFALGIVYWGAAVPTNLNISNNVFSNSTASTPCIGTTGNATGVCVGNKFFSSAYGANGITIADFGYLKCFDNWAVDAIDQAAIPIPLSATTDDVTEVAAGSNLERLEWLQKQADDIGAILGIDSSVDNVWYVDDSAGGSDAGTSFIDAETTLQAAINDAGDSTAAYIFIAENHDETLSVDIDVDCPGITIIGLGTGDARPIFTFDTATDCMTHTVPNVTWKNIIFTPSGQDCTAAVDLDGSSDGAIFEDCVWRSLSATDKEFLSCITFSAAACDNVRLTRCKFDNSGGTGATAAITNIVGAQVNLTIEDCEFNGVWSEAAINSTQADLNLVMRDNLVTNTATTKFAIELESASSTGFLVDNLCYANTYGSVIDPGGLKCYNNRVSSAINTSGEIYPAAPTRVDSVHGTGQVFYVDSSGDDSDGRTWATAKITIDKGINLCVADRGDFVYVAQGHTETVGAATVFTLDIAGISIIGLGNGYNMPIINMGNTATTILTTTDGDNCLIENIRFLATVTDVAICLNVVASTDYLTIRNCIFEAQTVGTDEFLQSILVGNACIGTTIDGCTFDNANGAAVAAISSDDDTDHCTIKNCTIMGDYSTACVEFSTVASTNMHILDNTIINGDLVADGGLNDQPCLEIFDSGSGFIKGNYFATDVAVSILAATVADDFVFMENFSTDDDGDEFEGTRRSDSVLVTPSDDT